MFLTITRYTAHLKQQIITYNQLDAITFRCRGLWNMLKGNKTQSDMLNRGVTEGFED